MNLKVDKDICIGCGACAAICPDVFEIDDDGLAKSIVDVVPEEVNEDIIEDAIDAKEGCPVDAIKEVNDKENNQEN